jgi:uncharacterized protein YggE
VVSGEGQVTVPADEVYVVVFSGFDEFGYGTPISAREAEEIRTGVAALDIDGDDVDLTSNSAYAGSSVRVRVAAAELPGVAEDVEGVIEDVIGRVDVRGLHLVVGDCNRRLGPALEDALAEARSAAELLAETAGLRLGAIESVSETVDPLAYYDMSDPCDPDAIGDGSSLVAYDAPTEVQLSARVVAQFAGLSPAPAAVTAHGRGEATGSADRATVVVLPDPDGDPFARSGGQARERRELLGAFADAGFDGDVVQFAQLPYSGFDAEVVMVEVDPKQLPEIGEDILDTIEDVTQAVGDAGVVFTSSRCDELLRTAQQAAIADAEAQMAELARAAEIELGDLTAAVDLSGPGITLDPFALEVTSGVTPCDVSDTIRSIDPYGMDNPLARFDARPQTSITSEILLSRAAS